MGGWVGRLKKQGERQRETLIIHPPTHPPTCDENPPDRFPNHPHPPTHPPFLRVGREEEVGGWVGGRRPLGKENAQGGEEEEEEGG